VAHSSAIVPFYCLCYHRKRQCPNNPVSVKQQDLLFIIIPAVACLCDVLIYCSVIAGILVQNRLRDAYATHVASVEAFPEIQGSRFTFWLGLAAPVLLPLVFLIAWLIIWSRTHRLI
jgi:hypothetical protein